MQPSSSSVMSLLDSAPWIVSPRPPAAPQTAEGLALQAVQLSRVTAAQAERSRLIIEGFRKDGFTADAQQAIHAELVELTGAYGLTVRQDGMTRLALGRVVIAPDRPGMGANANGSLMMGLTAMGGYLDYHAWRIGRLPELGPMGFYTRRNVCAHGAIHEQIHLTGPGWGPPVSNYTLVEELATEMAARQIASDVLGTPLVAYLEACETGGYRTEMATLVGYLADVATRSMAESHAALAQAALDYKRRTDVPQGLSVADALTYLAGRALHHLGGSAALGVELAGLWFAYAHHWRG